MTDKQDDFANQCSWRGLRIAYNIRCAEDAGFEATGFESQSTVEWMVLGIDDRETFAACMLGWPKSRMPASMPLSEDALADAYAEGWSDVLEADLGAEENYDD